MHRAHSIYNTRNICTNTQLLLSKKIDGYVSVSLRFKYKSRENLAGFMNLNIMYSYISYNNRIYYCIYVKFDNLLVLDKIGGAVPITGNCFCKHILRVSDIQNYDCFDKEKSVFWLLSVFEMLDFPNRYIDSSGQCFLDEKAYKPQSKYNTVESKASNFKIIHS